MRETVRTYAEIYGNLGLFTALEISLRSRARGFESLSLRQLKTAILKKKLRFLIFYEVIFINIQNNKGNLAMKSKIIYHIGDSINAQTVVKKGYIYVDEPKQRIEFDGGVYSLDMIKSIELYKMNGLGTMIKLVNKEDTIYFSVPRIFIDKGTGFAIINYFATKKLYKIMSRQ